MPFGGTRTDRNVDAYRRRLHRALARQLPKVLHESPIVTDRRARVVLPGDAGSLPEPASAPWAAPVRHPVAREDPRTSWPGDRVGHVDLPGDGSGDGPPGEDAADHGVEIVIPESELWDLIREAWHLPDLAPTGAGGIPEIERRWDQRRPVGPPARWLRRATLRERARHAGGLRATDLRYRQASDVEHPVAQAVVFLVRDVSGSMMADDLTRWIRATAFVLTLWLRHAYPAGVEVVFLTYDAQARIVDEPTFFGTVPGGGTVLGRALDLLADQRATAYPVVDWNAYAVVFTDGEDWNPRAVTEWVATHYTAWTRLGFVYVGKNALDQRSWSIFGPLAVWADQQGESPLVITRLTADGDVPMCLSDLLGTEGGRA